MSKRMKFRPIDDIQEQQFGEPWFNEVGELLERSRDVDATWDALRLGYQQATQWAAFTRGELWTRDEADEDTPYLPMEQVDEATS